jgi:hypothetical protein
MKSLLIISTHAINDGDELLLDYKLNPEFKEFLPKWYVPYNSNETTSRWKTPDLSSEIL